MSYHYSIEFPFKISYPDPIDTILTAQKPYTSYIKLDEDNAKVAEINRKEELERLAKALAMAWEHNSELRNEINDLKQRIQAMERYIPRDINEMD